MSPAPKKMSQWRIFKVRFAVNTMGWKTPATLSSSQAFLEFLIEQEIHYPSVSHHSVWNCLLTMLTGAFVCAVDTKLAERCCKTTDNIRLPSSSINSEAGAAMEQSTWWGGVCLGESRRTNTRVSHHTSEMIDDNKPLRQTYLKVCQAAVTMFGSRQFNRKSTHRTQTLPGSSHTSLTSGRWGTGTGGKRKLERREG